MFNRRSIYCLSFTLLLISFGTSALKAKSRRYTGAKPISSTQVRRGNRLPASALIRPKKKWTPEEIVKAFSLLVVRAWKRPDGAYRYDIVVKNTSPKDYTHSMGTVAVQRYKLDGTRWKPAGGHSIRSLKAKGVFSLKDHPWNGNNASKFRVKLRWNNKDYATKTISLGKEPGNYQDPLELKAREILSSISYPTFRAKVDVNGNAKYDLVIKNNSKHAFTAKMKRLTLHTYQSGIPAGFKSISAIPANGQISFMNRAFVDYGGNKFTVYLNYDKHPWHRKTITISGTAARDARAQAIMKKVTIEKLTAKKIGGGKAEFRVTLRNNSKWNFNRIGNVGIQSYVLVGNRWKPSGGWSINRILAGKTATKVQKFAHKNGTKLKIKIRLKGKTYTEKICPLN